MKLKLHCLLACMLLWITACEDKTPDCTPVTIERTVLIYIMGDNSLKAFVSSDIDEMIVGAANVDLTRNNLLVYMDDGSTVKLFRFMKNGAGTIVQDLIQSYDSNRNSVGLTEMKEVFSFVYQEYPAESYGLVLWSHGDGWKPGTSDSRWIGQDETNPSGDSKLSISTLNEVLGVIPSYEYILFDACFMQAVEVAYELRSHTGYFIGSPAEIPGPGAPYQKVVPALFAKNNAAFSVASSYYEYYSETYNEGKESSNDNWTAGVAISVIATDQLHQLAAATQEIIPTLINNGGVTVTGVLNYDKRSTFSSDHVGYYDFDDLMQKQSIEDASYTAWHNALKAAVPYAEGTNRIYSLYGGMFSISGFSGISTFVPRNNTSLNESYKSFEWYLDLMAN